MQKKYNKRALKKYCDSMCNVEDIKDTFEMIKVSICKKDYNWIDEYNYLLYTIKKLKKQGCNVKVLEKAFRRYERETFEPFNSERIDNRK